MATPGKRIIRTAVDWSNAGMELSAFLAGRFTYRTREEWISRIASGEITVNGKTVPPEHLLTLHETIEYRPQDIPEPPAQLDYRIVFEDDTVMVIDKPGNLCIHPSGPYYEHTLWYLLRTICPQIHFINRLDRETSGLLLAVKNSSAAARMTVPGMITVKSYLAIVHGDFTGTLRAEGFLVNAAAAIRKKRKFVTAADGFNDAESALTFLSARSGDGEFSLVSARLGTGRTHQIRATLYSLGYPVAGDKLYGLDENFFLRQKSEDFTPEDREKLIFSRQALHSEKLSFVHPESGEELHFHAPLPAELQNFIDNRNFVLKG